MFLFWFEIQYQIPDWFENLDPNSQNYIKHLVGDESFNDKLLQKLKEETNLPQENAVEFLNWYFQEKNVRII